jgi:hypothetical protein
VPQRAPRSARDPVSRARDPAVPSPMVRIQHRSAIRDSRSRAPGRGAGHGPDAVDLPQWTVDHMCGHVESYVGGKHRNAGTEFDSQ